MGERGGGQGISFMKISPPAPVTGPCPTRRPLHSVLPASCLSPGKSSRRYNFISPNVAPTTGA